MPAEFHQNTVSPVGRRHFLSRSATGILGASALAKLLADDQPPSSTTALRSHHPARAKRVIWLFMHGGPSQMDLLDYKPGLRQLQGSELPDSVRGNQRLTGMTSGQKTLPVAASAFRFSRHGQSGAHFSELLPHLAQQADRMCIVKSLHTEAINHDPAVTFLQTGHQQPGRPALGAWLSYGLGSENQNLPGFVVLLSNGSAARPDDPLHTRLWGSGFLPSRHQGVSFRSQGDPVLYLSNPPGIDQLTKQRLTQSLNTLNQMQYQQVGDPEIQTRIAQFELAGRMQLAVPELTDFSDETSETLNLYGEDVHRPGSFAANCVLARRLAERGVRSIQLYHRGWDQHYNLPSDLRLQCRDVDQPCAALLQDLNQRGLLEDTLIVWGGEFGRTVYSQGRLEATNYGRDHHGGCFTVWLAGGGIQAGSVYGETDDYSYNVIRNPMHVHDLNATILHCLGLSHEHLTYRSKGREFRLTDVEGHVVQGILS